MRTAITVVLLIITLSALGGCYLPDETHYFLPKDKAISVPDFPYRGFTITTQYSCDGHVEVLNSKGFLWKDGTIHFARSCSSLESCLFQGHYKTIPQAMDTVDKYSKE
jgi:hypothetical protein